MVSNRYSFLHIEGLKGLVKAGVFREMNGLGVNEVIIFTRRCVSFYEVTDEELFLGLWAARSRIISLKDWKHQNGSRTPVLEYVQVFGNQGIAGRASILHHAHMQLAGTPVILPEVRNIYQNGLQFFEETKEDSDSDGDCVFCHHAQLELGGNQPRLIAENDDFFVVTEFAPMYPYECGVYPKQHLSSFEDCSDKQIMAFAAMINQAIKRIGAVAGKPGFNFSLVNSPIKPHSLHPYFHFHARIYPRGIAEPAGFEISTGSAVNEYVPEVVAIELRDAKI